MSESQTGSTSASELPSNGYFAYLSGLSDLGRKQSINNRSNLNSGSTYVVQVVAYIVFPTIFVTSSKLVARHNKRIKHREKGPMIKLQESLSLAFESLSSRPQTANALRPVS